jgi:hypothetical protein
VLVEKFNECVIRQIVQPSCDLIWFKLWILHDAFHFPRMGNAPAPALINSQVIKAAMYGVTNLLAGKVHGAPPWVIVTSGKKALALERDIVCITASLGA